MPTTNYLFHNIYLFVGDWIIILVHLQKQFSTHSVQLPQWTGLSKNISDTAENLVSSLSLFDGVHCFVLLSVGVSYLSFFGLGGFLQYYYYIRQRDSVSGT